MTSSNDTDTNHHIRIIMDKVPSMLAYWDRDLRCHFANHAYEKWFGVDPDALLGTSIRDLLGPDLFAMNEPHMRAALAGEPQVFERIVPGPGGVERHSLAQYLPDDMEGQVRGFIVLVTDLTQLKETQAALKREKQLRTQIEEHAFALEKLLAERTQMLNVMAHEVRQPLNNASAALQSASGVLKDSGSPASHQLYRAQVVLGEVIAGLDNTLAVASLLARPNPIHREDTDIDTLIRVAVSDMPEAERGRIHVERVSLTRTASMDLSLMRLALRNLLSNALKFSAAEAAVLVRVSDSDVPLAVVIDVCDEGTGISNELRTNLFGRGARGGNKNAGHGMGLYIAAQVMLLHGGSVELAQSGPNGSTFRLIVSQTDD